MHADFDAAVSQPGPIESAVRAGISYRMVSPIHGFILNAPRRRDNSEIAEPLERIP